MRFQCLLILPLLIASLQAADKVIRIDFCAETNGNPGITLPVEPPEFPAIYVGDNVEIIVDTCDIINGSINSVVIGFNGEAKQAAPTGIPGQYSCIFLIQNSGVFNLTVIVTDSYGNVSVSDNIVFFTSTPSPPSASITSPTNGGDSPYSLGDIIAIDITATDSDGSVTAVEVFTNGQSLGLASLTGINTFRLNYIANTVGSINLQAHVTDNSGNTTYSNIETITVIAGYTPDAYSFKVPIVVDGLFEDWQDNEPIAIDPLGDVSAGGVDFSKIWMADDGTYLFIRFTTEILVDPSDNNNITLHIRDNSNRFITWNMGLRRGTFQDIEQNIFEEISYTATQFRSMPTLDANEFEVAFRLDSKPDGLTSLFQDDSILISIEDSGSGDRIPESGDGVIYQLGTNDITEEAPIGFEKKRSSDLRVVSYNVLFDNLFDPELQQGFRRQLQAVQPDVIHFQEIYSNSAEATRALIQSWLPPGEGDEWFTAKGSSTWNDTITVSRFPIISQWDLYGSTSPSGNLALLLDTEEEYGKKTLMVNVHLPCCGNDIGRQAEVDAIMAFIRDAREPGGELTLDENTPIVIAGDMNFVGQIGQLVTFLTGDIFNNELEGEDFAPDWDGSVFTSITPRHSDQRMGYTWRMDSSNNYSPGHLDYILYSDSVLDLVKSYVVHTPSMSSERLLLYGLEANDSLGSDHFLFVADFRPAFVDADGNGLPDFWELVTFGDVGTYTAMEDLDSDGSNNLDEFYAGTDPQDKNSRFAIQEYTVDESEISIRWNTITQRMYRLQGSFDLINWLGLNELMQGTGEVMEQKIPRDQSDHFFYRIVAE